MPVEKLREKVMRRAKHSWQYAQTLCKWVAVGVLIGAVGGAVGTLFHLGVDHAAELRAHHPWILYLLPLAGLVITAIYRLTKTEGKGTNDIIRSVHFGSHIPFWLVPAIFVSTVITHLCGGSAGREGAALQIGGGIGYKAGRLLGMNEKELPLATMCGMSGVFSALFGTPLTAMLFSLEVVSVGMLHYAGLIPCLTAALTAFWVASAMGVPPTRFVISAPGLLPAMMLKVAVLAALCAVVSILFCRVLHLMEHGAEHLLKNVWLRAAVGGAVLVALTLLLGTDYNGAGMHIIELAISGTARPLAWVWKILFTAITIGCGFKGGEVVPSFFIGAAFGCVVGPLLGLEAGFAAGIGLICVFCGAVNCPLASMVLSVELFGGEGMLYFAMACAISYFLSGYCGLYSSQTIVYSKMRAEMVNANPR